MKCKTLLVLFCAIFAMCLLSGCGESPRKEVEKYLEFNSLGINVSSSFTLTNGEYKFDYSYNAYSSCSTNCSLSFNVSINNRSTKKFENYQVTDVRVMRESNNVIYDSNYSPFFGGKTTLQPDISESFSLKIEIPTSISSEKYTLYFTDNNANYIFHLYEMPLNLREDRELRYYVSGKLVKTATVKDRTKVTQPYTYDSTDHLHYCSDWHIDTRNGNQFTSSMLVDRDLNLYCELADNLGWITTSSDAYSFLNRVNHIHSDGVLALPRTHLNKEITIGSYAIHNIKISKLYIPNTVHRIYGGNFTGTGSTTIYYEGTRAEWEMLFYSQSDIVTANVVFNTAAPSF